MYEVSIRLKEDASRPPQTSISDQALYKECNNNNNHTTADTHNFENENDESSISSMSSYGTTGDDVTAIHTTDNKGEVLLISTTTDADAAAAVAASVPVPDETVTTDISSDARNDDCVEATHHQHGSQSHH
jgi:hypothetical protein